MYTTPSQVWFNSYMVSLCSLIQTYNTATSNLDVLRRVTHNSFILLTFIDLWWQRSFWISILGLCSMSFTPTLCQYREAEHSQLTAHTHTHKRFNCLVVPLYGTQHLPLHDSIQQALCGLLRIKEFKGIAHFYTSRMKNFIHIWNNAEWWHLIS